MIISIFVPPLWTSPSCDFDPLLTPILLVSTALQCHLFYWWLLEMMIVKFVTGHNKLHPAQHLSLSISLFSVMLNTSWREPFLFWINVISLYIKIITCDCNTHIIIIKNDRLHFAFSVFLLLLPQSVSSVHVNMVLEERC